MEILQLEICLIHKKLKKFQIEWKVLKKSNSLHRIRGGVVQKVKLNYQN